MLTALIHKKSKKTRAILLGASAVAVLAGASIAWALWPKDPAKIIAQLGDDPRKVWEAVEQGKLTREQAGDAMRERFEAEQNKRMDEYFALPAGAQRDRYLDKMIDEMEARRREWEQRRPTTAPTTRPAREERGPTTRPSDKERQQRMAMRDDNTPPARRAQRVEFMAAMMKRMQQRGIQARGPGGGGGFRGWGGGGGGMRGGGGGGGRDGGQRGNR